MVSVVLPVRDGAATIAEQLDSLLEQQLHAAWEAVVVDNGSVDATASIVRSYCAKYPQLRVVSAPNGTGINFARNAGVQAARGKFIVICDADDVVQPGWLAAHARELVRGEAELTGGPLDEDSLNRPGIAAMNRVRDSAKPPCAGSFLPYAVGCNIGFSKSLWQALGGFNDLWQRGGTEIEFCWRAQLAGYTLLWVPDAIVAYRHRTTRCAELVRRFRSAQAMARLHSEFAEEGMPRASNRRAARAWAWLAFKSPRVFFDQDFGRRWTQTLAWKGGLLVGSVRYRVLYL